MSHQHVLVLVADAVKARFLAPEGESLKEIKVLENPEGHLHGRDLVSDRPGRGYGQVGTARYGMDDGDPVFQQHVSFAREIAHYLEEELNHKRLTDLTIFAGPEFLGILRSCFPKHLKQIVVSSTPKDLTRASNKEIRSEILFPLVRLDKPHWD